MLVNRGMPPDPLLKAANVAIASCERRNRDEAAHIRQHRPNTRQTVLLRLRIFCSGLPGRDSEYASSKRSSASLTGPPPLWAKIAAMVPCTAPFNYLGLPALSMPCGFTPNGVPTGFQLVARPCGEPTLLRVAQAYEPFSAPLLRVPSPP